MSSNKINEELLKFLEKSPTSFHAVANIAEILGKRDLPPLTEKPEMGACAGRKILCDKEWIFHPCFHDPRERLPRVSDHSQPQRFPILQGERESGDG